MDRIILRIKQVIEYLLMFSLLMMVLINFVDVSGRHLFNRPIFGIQDLTEHLMALVVFSGLPLVTMAGTHLTVDLFDKLTQSSRMQWWRHVIHGLMVVILCLIAWTFIQSALEAHSIADVSTELRLPRAPLYLLMAGSAILSALGLLYMNYLPHTTATTDLPSSSGGEL